MAPIDDPNTLSNHHDVVTRSTDVVVSLNFDAGIVAGYTTLQMAVLKDGISEVVLDTSYLNILAVEVNGKTSDFRLDDRVNLYGSALHILISDGLKEGASIDVKIVYATTDKSTALQWMTPEQTSNKKAPYMFSQCQAIHARSLFPCQDTPAVKSKFNFSIRSPYPVVASGLPTGVKDYENGTLVYTFRQEIPIPSYLFAVASGDLASAAIGPRSMVYTGPEELLKCKTELEVDTEPFIQIAESLIYPYAWTTYSVLVLPPSFPYGGMENPQVTFATPTIISGDRSNVDVIAHELSHSWSGNLVSNGSWEHFWLNEGWTTYLERRIQGALYGEQFFHFSAIIGWKAFKESVEEYGADHEFTKLVVDLKGKDPDDSFSSVPYEKGFNFLYLLDRLIGREKWDKFIPYYFAKYREMSLTSYDFKDTLLEFFANDSDTTSKLQCLDWDQQFFSPGLPPKPDFDTTLVDRCYALSERWAKLPSEPFIPNKSDIDGWIAGQIVVFLESLTDLDHPLSVDAVRLMRDTYKFLESPNAEILSRFLVVGLKAGDRDMSEPAAEFVGSVGRMKFVRPLMRELNKIDQQFARETYEKNIKFWHPICREAVRKDLGL